MSSDTRNTQGERNYMQEKLEKIIHKIHGTDPRESHRPPPHPNEWKPLLLRLLLLFPNLSNVAAFLGSCCFSTLIPCSCVLGITRQAPSSIRTTGPCGVRR